MRELLKQCAEIIDAYSDGHHPILGHIEDEISRPVEPDYWRVVDRHGNSIYSAPFKEACTDHLMDVIERSDIYSLAEAASLVVRPLFTHPPRKPVLLSDDEIVDIYPHTAYTAMTTAGICDLSRAIEQAVLRKNGLGGVE